MTDSVGEQARIAAQRVYLENGMTELTLNYCNAHKHHKDFLLQFAKIPEIKSIAKLPF